MQKNIICLENNAVATITSLKPDLVTKRISESNELERNIFISPTNMLGTSLSDSNAPAINAANPGSHLSLNTLMR